jgi:NAD(P)-dependent dehydrogenase (short-subunit alcohol dehydrogenase family)
MAEQSLETLFGVRDKVVVVTGGGGVLGKAMSRALVAQGARVAIMNRTPQTVERAAEELRGVGPGDAMGVPCDVTRRESIVKARETVEEAWGPAEILVNAAGGNHKSATTGGITIAEQLDPTFFDLDEEAIRFVMDLNFLGTVMACQEFGRAMVEKKNGCIVNISSMTAYTPLTKVATYSAAKAAVNSITRWLSVHFAPAGVRVNAIAPGFFLTEQNRFLLTDEKTGDLTPRGRTIVDHTPLRRFGAPEELCGTLLWLISPGAGFVTGTVVPVDGGFSAFSGV